MDKIEYQRLYEVEEHMWWFAGLRANLLAAARDRLGPAPRILDAGSGTGGLLAALGQTLPAACRHGLDISPLACRLAHERSGALIAAGSINHLPFATASFDAILSADVLCHAAVEEQAALAELHRCLKPGAKLILNLPAFRWMLSAHDERVHNVRRYTRAEAIAMLRHAGFVNARAFYWNSLLFPLMMVQRLLRRRDAATSDVALFPWPLDRLFRAALALERGLFRLGIRFPFGGSILVTAEKA